MPQLNEIIVMPPSPGIDVGSTQQFHAIGVYNNGSSADLTNSATWSSSDPTIVAIDVNGLATGAGVGTATITAASDSISGSATPTVAGAPAGPPPPGTPADYLLKAQKQLFLLVTGQATQAIETPQLGRVQYHPTTPGDLQRAITYLQGLVLNGNTWPTTPGAGGSMTTGFSYGRKPFSIYGMP